MLLVGGGGDRHASSGARMPSTPTSGQFVTVSVVFETSVHAVGKTVRLVAPPRNSDGAVLSKFGVRWISDATGVATVAATGVERGLSPQLVRITAVSEGRTRAASISFR